VAGADCAIASDCAADPETTTVAVGVETIASD
jgi:hypothetical protein